jgi:Ca2+-binding RTX toxin-like protein
VSGIRNLTGSVHDDILYGNGLGNSIDGGSGADAIGGRGGADTLTAAPASTRCSTSRTRTRP